MMRLDQEKDKDPLSDRVISNFCGTYDKLENSYHDINEVDMKDKV